MKSPIICDVTLLPEHPADMTWSAEPSAAAGSTASSNPSSSSSMTSLPLVRVPQNHINPCGIANVMILQDASFLQTGPILFSLTSCHVRHDLPDAGGTKDSHREGSSSSIFSQQGTTTRHLLPVKPIPSTFVVPFGSRESNSVPMAELSVEFDFFEASRRAKELWQTVSIEAESVGNVGRSHQKSFHYEQEGTGFVVGQSGMAKTIESTDDTTGFAWTNHSARRGNPKDSLATNPDSCTDDRSLLLSKLRNRMEQETHSLNRILYVLALVGLLLLGMLFWAVYHYHRSSRKAEAQAQEIRASMQKTRDVLTTTVQGIRMQPLALNEKLRDVKEQVPVQQVEVEISSIGPCTPPARTSSSDALASQSDSPLLLEFDEKVPGGSTNSIHYDNLLPAHTPKAPRPRSFLRPQERRWFGNSFSTSTSSAAQDSAKKRWGLSHMQKEWVENKATRRSHRKEGRPLLRPATISPPAQRQTNALNERHRDYEDNSDVSLLTQTENKAEFHNLTVRGERDIVPSGSSDDVGYAQRPMSHIRKENRQSSGVSLSLSPISPSLCDTRGFSDDSSFVNDYW